MNSWPDLHVDCIFKSQNAAFNAQSLSKNQNTRKLYPYWLLHFVLTAPSHSHLRGCDKKVTELYEPIQALDSTATAICQQLIQHVT